jgi:Acetoacetate decarboxylase (ADC)
VTEPVSQHTVAGTVLTMPVKIRKATQHTAMFSVDADAAQAMIDYSGLHVSRYLPGRAVIALILAHFIDGDLGEYHELSTGVMIDEPGGKGVESAGAAVGVHSPHARRPGLHLGSGTDYLGISESHGRFHDP